MKKSLLSQKSAMRTSIKSMSVNLFLFIFKLICGLAIRSGSLVSDAVHSLSDIFSTGIVMCGIKLSSRPSDKSHPYGHEKMEAVIALGLGVMLFFIGGRIGYDGIQRIISPEPELQKSPLLYTVGIICAITSILFKEWMYRFTVKCARSIKSKAMEADAWHHRTDALSSIGSLAGVIGIAFGLPLIDSIACIIISLFIIKAALDITCDSFNSLVDHSCPDKMIREIEKNIKKLGNDFELDTLKTRMFGSKIYMDLEITVDKDLPLHQAHKIASDIHDRVEKDFCAVKHCMVHVNPSDLTPHHHI